MRALLAVIAVVCLAGAAVAPAVAQEAPAQADVELTLTELTGVLGPGSVRPSPEAPADDLPTNEEFELRVLVENHGDVSLGGLQLVVEVHPAAPTRGSLRAAFRGELDGPPLHVHSRDVAAGQPVGPDELHGLEEVFARDEIDWASEPGGVHPVRVALTRGTEVLDELVTAVVWLQELPTERMLTTALWPFETAPWRHADGAYEAGVDAELRRGERLDTLLTALEGQASEPIVLAPSGHLLEDLSDRVDGYGSLERRGNGEVLERQVPASGSGPVLAAESLTRLRELAADLPTEPISGPYADAHLSALLDGEADLRELAASAAVEGRRRVQLQLGTDVDVATHLLRGRLDPAVLDLLPGDQVILPSAATQRPPLGGDPELGEPVRQLRAPSGRLLTALIADPYLEEALAALEGGSPVAAAQRPVAESAMAYLTAPGTADRGLVVLPPAGWDPGPAAANRLLEQLTTAPWLQLVAPGELAAQGRPGPAGTELAPPAATDPEVAFPSGLADASRDLAAAAAAQPDDDGRLGTRSVGELRDDLLRATSTWLAEPANDHAQALVRGVEHTAADTFGEIEVASGGVTLTSDAGQIPVTLQRTDGEPIVVDVVLDSPGTLQWPEGRTAERVLLESESSQTLTFPTQALSTGTFPVTVRVTDPAGGRELVRSTLPVRSTAISTPALATTALVVLVLLVVGVTRRVRSPEGADEGAVASAAEPGAAGSSDAAPALRVVERANDHRHADDGVRW